MIPDDAIIRLKQTLDMLPLRCSERRIHIQRIADSYGCSIYSVYRKLRSINDYNKPQRNRGLPKYDNHEEFIKWIEIVAAIKHRSLNKKGHHISTTQAIHMAERGFRDSRSGQWIQIPKGVLTRQTCDRWLRKLGLNKSGHWESTSVRFGATSPNEVWQFDLSPSDIYYFDSKKGIVEDRSWRTNKKNKRRPKLMLYSVIDDFARVEYMEYHLCYGEDVETALRFFYRAMDNKGDSSFPFKGIPNTLYMDNGPIAKSGIFLQVMERLGIKVKVHETPNKAKGRTAARSKGKIERSFRTCKNSFESLFQFQKPKTLSEANEELCVHLLNTAYQQHPYWNEKRIDVWYKNLPEKGIRQICDWEQYRDLARKPCNRRVSNDCLVIFDHQHYLVDEEFKNSKVKVWRGLLDDGLFVQSLDGNVYGPYKPAPTPLPFGKFKKPKKTELDIRREKIIDLAQHIDMPKKSVFIDNRNKIDRNRKFNISGISIEPTSPTGILDFINSYTAKKAIYEEFGIPLGRLNENQRQRINLLITKTLRQSTVLSEAKKIIDELKENVKRDF